VIAGDADATGRRRAAAREERGQKAVPVREWMKSERQRILDRDMIVPAQRMYAESMRLSDKWAREFREFWDLPEDFVFDVPTPEVDLAMAIQQTAHDGQSPSIASAEGSA
jgi:acetone carboxylase alpha subunit